MGADRFSVRGSLSRLSWGSPALVVARFLAACWLGGWRRRAGNGSRRWCGGPSAGFRRHGCRRKAPMDGFTASRTRAPHTASTEAAPRNGRGPGTPPAPRLSPAAQAQHRDTENAGAPATGVPRQRDSESAHDQATDDGDEEVGPERQPDERALPGGDGGGLETAEIAPHPPMLVPLDEHRPPPAGNPANMHHPQIVGDQHLVTGL